MKSENDWGCWACYQGSLLTIVYEKYSFQREGGSRALSRDVPLFFFSFYQQYNLMNSKSLPGERVLIRLRSLEIHRRCKYFGDHVIQAPGLNSYRPLQRNGAGMMKVDMKDQKNFSLPQISANLNISWWLFLNVLSSLMKMTRIQVIWGGTW